LVEAQQLGIREAQLLQDYPYIAAADLVNAWAYAAAYREEIAAAMRANKATQIDAAIALEEALSGKLIRVVRPAS